MHARDTWVIWQIDVPLLHNKMYIYLSCLTVDYVATSACRVRRFSRYVFFTNFAKFHDRSNADDNHGIIDALPSRSPLHVAVLSRNVLGVRTLLSFGVDVDAKDGRDRTPLFMACQIKAVK